MHPMSGASTPGGVQSVVESSAPRNATHIEQALAEYLRSKPNHCELMNRAGLYLRGRNLSPPEGLKKFITARPSKFLYLKEYVRISAYFRC